MAYTDNYLKNKENPFLKMDAETCYWIGYIFADGSISCNYSLRNYSISLYSKNIDILQRFKLFIGEKAHMYSNYSNNVSCVRYHSKSITEWFIKTFNVGEKKALTLNPTIDIDWDILHGYFDGDGCIRLTKHKSGHSRYEMKFTTGSVLWKDRIVEFLTKYNIRTHVNKKGNAFDINITGKEQLFFMYKNLYRSNTSKLDYKYNQFVALFGDK